MKTLKIFAILLAAAVAACASPQDDADVATTDAAMTQAPSAAEPIAALIERYEETYNAEDAAGIAAFYTDDAQAWYPDATFVNGRAAVQQRHQATFAAGDPHIEITLTDEMTFGDRAVDIGTYKVTTTPPGGEPIDFGGSYMSLLERTPEGWKIARHIVNYDSEQPAAMLAGAPESTPPPEAGTLNALYEAYEDAFEAGDNAALANLFAEDAMFADIGQPIAQGRAAIAGVQRLVSGGSLDIHGVETVDLGGGWALDRGWWDAVVADTPLRGRYMLLVRTDPDGTQKIVWHVAQGRPVSAIPPASE